MESIVDFRETFLSICDENAPVREQVGPTVGESGHNILIFSFRRREGRRASLWRVAQEVS